MLLSDCFVYIILLFITVSHSETITDDSIIIFPDTYETMIRSNHTTPPPINHTESECLTCGPYLAGHCVYDNANDKAYHADEFKVAVGKVHRLWSHPQDEYNEYAQKSQVKSIHIPQEYKGQKNYFQHNIAVLEMAKIFTLNDHVRPICLDLYNDNFNQIQLTPGTIGTVAGWGLTEEDGEPSDLLQDLEVPVIAMVVCRTEMAKYNFLPFLTSDTFCAGYTTGWALCKGDSGGALAIPAKSMDNTERWYMRGIVSLAPVNPKTGSCRSDSYTVYTEVYKLKEFLLKKFFELNFLLD